MNAPVTDGRWWFWAGRAEDVDAEGIYTHGECATRDQVIADILPELHEGEEFCVIEAQFDQSPDLEGDEYQPFAASRNQEFLTKRDGVAVPTPAVDA